MVTPPRTGRPGRPREAPVVVPAGLAGATGHEHKANGRVASVSTTLVFGTGVMRALALAVSAVSRGANAAGVGRHTGTARGRCRRKGRKRSEFSNAWDGHVAATRFGHLTDNVCGPVRTLRVTGADGRGRPRPPAVTAGLTDHVWSLREWITLPAVRRRQDTTHPPCRLKPL